jgi:hypothetical protein
VESILCKPDVGLTKLRKELRQQNVRMKKSIFRTNLRSMARLSCVEEEK